MLPKPACTVLVRTSGKGRDNIRDEWVLPTHEDTRYTQLDSDESEATDHFSGILNESRTNRIVLHDWGG